MLIETNKMYMAIFRFLLAVGCNANCATSHPALVYEMAILRPLGQYQHFPPKLSTLPLAEHAPTHP